MQPESNFLHSTLDRSLFYYQTQVLVSQQGPSRSHTRFRPIATTSTRFQNVGPAETCHLGTHRWDQAISCFFEGINDHFTIILDLVISSDIEGINSERWARDAGERFTILRSLVTITLSSSLSKCIFIWIVQQTTVNPTHILIILKNR